MSDIYTSKFNTMSRIEFTNVEDKQNYLSVDQKTAINSYGEIFHIEDLVEHEDEEAGIAKIEKFELDMESNEVKVITDKGWAHIDFISKTLTMNNNIQES